MRKLLSILLCLMLVCGTAGATVDVSDGFTDNNATTLPNHQTDGTIGGGSGYTWETDLGEISITSNTAMPTELTANAIDGGPCAWSLITQSFNNPQVSANLTINDNASNIGLMLRYIDNLNFINVFFNKAEGKVYFEIVVAGEFSLNTTSVGTTYSAGAKLEVKETGNVFDVFYNDSHRIHITNSELASGGKNGLIFYNPNSAVLVDVMDDFVIGKGDWDVKIETDTNDGYRQGTSFFNVNYNLYAGSVSGICDTFIRFPFVTIPVGATITEAYITLYEQASGGTPLTKIYADDQANPTAATSSADLNGRTVTTASVDMDGNPAAGAFNTPSLVSIVQELVDSYDYSSGPSMQFFIKDDGGANGNYLELSSFSTYPTQAPKLHITYTTPSNTQGQVILVNIS